MMKGKKLFRGRRKGNRMLHGRYLAGAMAAALAFTVILPVSEIKAEELTAGLQALLGIGSLTGGNAAEDWTDIIEISAGDRHTVALKSDGTVVATGHNFYCQCNVSGWKNIIGISAGCFHTVGFRADGTVVALGDNEYSQANPGLWWRNIVGISAGDDHTVGIKSNGTVVALGNNDYGQCDVSEWSDIVEVSAGDNHTVGLKTDGTVVAVGNNEFGGCDVSEWSDIIEVSAGRHFTVGLKTDGTVAAAGADYEGQCDVSEWKDVIEVSAGDNHTIGLKTDGTVVAAGDNYYGQCDVSEWRDIVGISAGGNHTVGLKTDGTVVTTGSNEYGQCDIGERTNIISGSVEDEVNKIVVSEIMLDKLPLTLEQVMSFDPSQDYEEALDFLQQEAGVDDIYFFREDETGNMELADSYEESTGFYLADLETYEIIQWSYGTEIPVIRVYFNKEVSQERGPQLAEIIETYMDEKSKDLVKNEVEGTYLWADSSNGGLYQLAYDVEQWGLTLGRIPQDWTE